MSFEDILNDIKKMIGQDLFAINPKTEPINLLEVDVAAGRYVVKPLNGRVVKRSLSELEKIWEKLIVERAANVELVLEGAGSSRHHPETIFANLPYIDHFKFNNKKHLYLQLLPTHEIGTTHKLDNSEARKVRSVLESSSSFDRVAFAEELGLLSVRMHQALQEVFVKYPGEGQVQNVLESLERLDKLKEALQRTYISPYPSNSKTNDGSFEKLLNSPEYKGYEDGEEDKNDEIVVEAQDIKKGKKFELASARIRDVNPTVSLLFDRLTHKEIILQPDFQRRDRIWSRQDKSALVESILIGLPIPSLYFAEKSEGDWLVVDGLQRLTTLKDFMEGEFSLSKLEILEDIEGFQFKSLPRHYQRKFREYPMHSHIISMDHDEDDEVVKELFQRINTHGVRLSYQEIRCSLYAGSSVHFIRCIAESEMFTRTTFNSINPSRMRDMEFVLGAVSFILFGYENYSENKFDSFLGKAMKVLNKYQVKLSGSFPTSYEAIDENYNPPHLLDDGTDAIFRESQQRLKQAFDLAEFIFENRRYTKVGKNKPILNKPLFEIIVTVFASMNDFQLKIAQDNAALIRDGLIGLMNNTVASYVDWESEAYNVDGRDFIYSISQSTGKRVTIQYRFGNFRSLVEKVIGQEINMKGIRSNDYKPSS